MAPLQLQLQLSRRGLETALLSLKPAVRAYALAYLASTTPRLPAWLRTAVRQDLPIHQKLRLLHLILTTPLELHRFPTACAIIVSGATCLPRLTRVLLRRLLLLLGSNQVNDSKVRLRLLGSSFYRRLTFLTVFVSAWLAFDLLNRDERWSRRRAQSLRSQRALSARLPSQALALQENVRLAHEVPNQHHHPPSGPDSDRNFAGKTIDFTLFAFCRALDVSVVTLWTWFKPDRFHPERYPPRTSRAVKSSVAPVVFSTSAAVIMWSWFYSPMRLPRAYNHWISKIADIDSRLIQTLRLCRQGDFVYGLDTGNADLLGSLSSELGLPYDWGDPAKTIPVPCEVYHCGIGHTSSSTRSNEPSFVPDSSTSPADWTTTPKTRVAPKRELEKRWDFGCERHAVARFWRAWKFGLKVYLPLQLLPLFRLFQQREPLHLSFSTSRLWRRVFSLSNNAARSASFLATFVSLFYYAVCLARTRLGPKILSRARVTPQMWDSGLCVLAGCLVCGWSILLERSETRRQEMALFVFPRALATLLPRVYDAKQYRWRERAVFAGSVAIVLDAVVGVGMRSGGAGRKNGEENRVRGVLGRVLASVVRM